MKKIFNTTLRHHRFASLPEEVSANVCSGVLLPIQPGNFRFYSSAQFEILFESVKDTYVRRYLANSYYIDSARMLAEYIFIDSKRRGMVYSTAANVAVRFKVNEDFTEITIDIGKEDND